MVRRRVDRRWVTLLLAAAGCSADLTIPEGASIRCGPAGGCPQGYVCVAVLGRCVLAGRRDQDQDLPAVVGDPEVHPVVGRAGTTFSVRFAASEPLAEDPVVRLEAGGRELVLALVEDGTSRPDATYEYEHTASGDEPEGRARVAADLVDTAGNVSRGVVLGDLVLDFTPPGVPAESVAVVLVPAPDNPLLEVERVTVGTTVRVTFSVTEPLGEVPVVRAAAPSLLELAHVDSVGMDHVFTRTLGGPGPHAQGEHRLQVTVTDEVGNRATVPLALPPPGLVVDTERPAALTTEEEQLRVRYRRARWGSRDPAREGGEADPEYSVRADADAFEPGSLVFFWELVGETFARARTLPHRVDEAGGFEASGPALLSTADRPEVWLSVVDAAGNESDKARIRRGEWVSTLRHKVAGSVRENPASFAVTDLHRAFRDDADAREPDHVAPLGQVGDPHAPDPIAVDGRTRWTLRRGAVPSARAGAALAYDRLRGRVVLFGGARLELVLEPVFHLEMESFSDTWEWDPYAGRWEERTPEEGEDNPLARNGHALAWDSARETVLLFGGRTDTVLDDTWEWDGRTGRWSQVQDPEAGWSGSTHPARRCGHAMVLDAARNKIVLFGGVWSDDHFSDLWEWDGALEVWTARTPDPLPAVWPGPRQGHRLAWDAGRGKVLLFGGSCREGGRRVALADLWEWDGETGEWVDRTPDPLPAAWPVGRLDASVAFDPGRSRLQLFGGLHVVAGTGDPCPEGGRLGGDGITCCLPGLWEWDGAAGSWESVGAGEGPWPAACAGSAATFHHAARRLVLFGGTDAVGTPRRETWTWAGETLAWTDRTPDPARPVARRAHALAYDAHRGVAVLFGGLAGEPLDDLWRWDGWRGAWTDLTPPDRPEGAWPPARKGHALAWDDVRDRLLLFGGCAALDVYWACAEPLADLWAWSPEDGWSSLAPDPLPSPWPAAGEGRTLVFDGPRDRLVLHGGGADVWEWRGGEAVWERHEPPGGEVAWPALSRHAAVLDGPSGLVVVTGGQDLLTWDENPWIWGWDGEQGTWAQLYSGQLLISRMAHGLVFDPWRDALLQFGGRVGGSRVAADLLEWSPRRGHLRWGKLAPLGQGPSARQEPGMVYDAARRRTLLFGGRGQMSSHADTWELDTAVDRRPAALWSVPWSAAGVPGARVLELAASVRAAGRAYELPPGEGAEVPGATLRVWDPVAAGWSDVADNAAGAATGGDGDPEQDPSLDFRTTDPARLKRLLAGPDRRVTFAITPRGDNGRGGDRREDVPGYELARLEVDYVEASWSSFHTGCLPPAPGCRPGDGTCSHGTFDGTPCLDGDPATQGELCLRGECRVAPELARYRLVTEPADWDAAQRRCGELLPGGHLVVIGSEEEERLVQGLVHYTHVHVWIGLVADGDGMPPRWVDGEPVTWTDWVDDPGAPAERLCARLAGTLQTSPPEPAFPLGHRRFRWVLTSCEERLAQFVCEGV